MKMIGGSLSSRGTCDHKYEEDEEREWDEAPEHTHRQDAAAERPLAPRGPLSDPRVIDLERGAVPPILVVERSANEDAAERIQPLDRRQPPRSATERSNVLAGSAGSSKRRRSRILPAMYCTSPGPSSRSTPSSTMRPCAIRPASRSVAPSTIVTEAEVTR